MNTSKIKLPIATAALLVASAAMAQGTPPNANVANPALGAGQQTQQGTSMGATGVPTPAPGTPAQPGMQPAPSASPGMAPTPMAPAGTTAEQPMRPPRADRN